MTSDATQTELVAARSEKPAEELTRLIRNVRVVLWDFDGPICRVFASRSAQTVTDGLVGWLESRGLRGVLTEVERNSPDPQVVLRSVDRRHPCSDLVFALEERLSSEELRAVETAMPTAYADILIQTWRARGVHLAVTTNNSPRAVRAYLDVRGLTHCFAPHIYGRTQDLHRLKPDPHCLNRALNAIGAASDTTLMIGDSPSDLEAARRAGVSFLGYAGNGRNAKLLTAAGAAYVVASLQPLLEVLRQW